MLDSDPVGLPGGFVPGLGLHLQPKESQLQKTFHGPDPTQAPWGGCCATATCNQKVNNSRAGTGIGFSTLRLGGAHLPGFLDTIPLRQNRWKCRARGTRSI